MSRRSNKITSNPSLNAYFPPHLILEFTQKAARKGKVVGFKLKRSKVDLH